MDASQAETSPAVGHMRRVVVAMRLIAAIVVAIGMQASLVSADDVPQGGVIERQGNPEGTSSQPATEGVTTSGPAATQPARLANDPRLARWRYTIFWSLILLVIFMSAAIAIVVFSRRYRQFLSQTTRHEKTEYVDVWKMHKVPENLDIEPDDEPAEPNDDDEDDDDGR